MAIPSRLRKGPALATFAFVVVAGGLGVLIGPATLTPREIGVELLDRLPLVSMDSGLSDREAAILWEIRVPRVVLGGLVGSILAVSGAAYQGVFRNPLADPYLLGVAAGAGLGATVVIAAGGDTTGLLLPAAAFLGAVVAVLVTYAAGGVGKRRNSATLILAGVAVASFFTALQTFVQQRSADTVREVFSWILGRLATVGWDEVRLLLPYAVVSAGALLTTRRLLDLLAVGEEEATTLGVRADRVRLAVVAAATLGTAAAVAVSGLIAFVGIIVPHGVRLLFGVSYRSILPLSLLAGAGFLVLADLLARTVLSPAELPIGVVTAFIGAPFFVFVLRRALGVQS
jgi:iron complex transport system permease protein